MVGYSGSWSSFLAHAAKRRSHRHTHLLMTQGPFLTFCVRGGADHSMRSGGGARTFRDLAQPSNRRAAFDGPVKKLHDCGLHALLCRPSQARQGDSRLTRRVGAPLLIWRRWSSFSRGRGASGLDGISAFRGSGGRSRFASSPVSTRGLARRAGDPSRRPSRSSAKVRAVGLRSDRTEPTPRCTCLGAVFRLEPGALSRSAPPGASCDPYPLARP